MSFNDWIPGKHDFRRVTPSPPQFRVSVIRFLFISIIVLIVSGIVEITLQILGINVVFPEEIQITQLLSVVGSLFLSAALVYLYYQQKEILSAEHRSMVSINRFIGGDDDVIDILVSNSGDGSVHSILLKVEVEFEDGDISGGENHLGLRTTEENGNERGFVKPFEAERSFTKKLLLPVSIPDGPDYQLVPFHQAMSFADNFGATEGHLTLKVIWEDTIQTDEITIFDEDFQVSRRQSFEEFLQLFPEHYRST